MIPGDGEELHCPAVGDVAAVAGGGGLLAGDLVGVEKKHLNLVHIDAFN